MKPNRKPTVCIVVLTSAKRRKLDVSQAAFCPARQSYDASSRNESARTWRQPGTGNVRTLTSNDNENFTPLATVKRWFCGAIAVLAATGILLIALAGAIIWLTETYNLPWLLLVLAGLELWFIVRMVDQ